MIHIEQAEAEHYECHEEEHYFECYFSLHFKLFLFCQLGLVCGSLGSCIFSLKYFLVYEDRFCGIFNWGCILVYWDHLRLRGLLFSGIISLLIRILSCSISNYLDLFLLNTTITSSYCLRIIPTKQCDGKWICQLSVLINLQTDQWLPIVAFDVTLKYEYILMQVHTHCVILQGIFLNSHVPLFLHVLNEIVYVI